MIYCAAASGLQVYLVHHNYNIHNTNQLIKFKSIITLNLAKLNLGYWMRSKPTSFYPDIVN